MPKCVRLKPEQIVAKLREIEVKIGQARMYSVPVARLERLIRATTAGGGSMAA